MNRSRFKNSYFKNKTVENWEKYRKLRNEVVKLTKKVKKEYLENLNLKFVNDNKTFWKTVMPYLSNRSLKKNKIILVEKDNIINENKNTAEVFNDYFINVLKDLDIPEICEENVNADLLNLDMINLIIYKYRKHPSILRINEFVHIENTFSFKKATFSHFENEIFSLNPNKTTGADSIPAKIVKESIDIVKTPLTKIFNASLDKGDFPADLKLPNVFPLYKKYY